MLPGAAPAGVGLEVGGLDPGRLQRQRPLPLGDGYRVGEADGAVATLDATGTGAGRPQRGGRVGAGPQLDGAMDGRSVIGEAGVAEDDLGTRRLEGRALELGPPRGEQRVTLGWFGGEWGAEGEAGRLDDGLPAGAAAEMGPQCRLDRVRAGWGGSRLERGQPHQDARRAESALAGPGGREGLRPAPAKFFGQALGGRDLAAGHPAHRCHTRDTGGTVDPHGAAAALALRAAAVLGRAAGQLVAQRIEERDAVGNGHRVPVEAEGHGPGREGVARVRSDCGAGGSS